MARHLWTIEDWAALKTQAGGKEHLWSPKYALAGDDGTWCVSCACGLLRSETCLPEYRPSACCRRADARGMFCVVCRGVMLDATTFGSPPVSML